MQKYYQLRIPEPCHEDWNKMTPSDKGRFCSSCSKTVVDFTVMNNFEIQEFLQLNAGQKLCGHVRKSQLDRLKITIPATVLQQSWLGHRAFLLALLITMGTTLMSCKDNLGNQQKIDEVTVVDSLNQGDDLIEGEIMMGMLPPPEPPVEVMGDMIMLEGMVENNNEVPFAIVEDIPRFPNTPIDLTKNESKDYFNDQMRIHIETHFNKDIYTQTKGRQKITTQFAINEKGSITDIKVRASFPEFENETRRVLELLPVFTPGKQHGINSTVIYSLPIIFEVD